MTHITCRLTAKNGDQLRNPTLDNRVRATFFYIPGHHIHQLTITEVGWRRGVVVSGIRRMNPASVAVCTGMGDRLGEVCTISVCNQPTESTQPYILLGSLNRVLDYYHLCSGKGEDVTSAGWQVTLCDPTWM